MDVTDAEKLYTRHMGGDWFKAVLGERVGVTDRRQPITDRRRTINYGRRSGDKPSA